MPTLLYPRELLQDPRLTLACILFPDLEVIKAMKAPAAWEERLSGWQNSTPRADRVSSKVE